jgi:hypothetical protein
MPGWDRTRTPRACAAETAPTRCDSWTSTNCEIEDLGLYVPVRWDAWRWLGCVRLWGGDGKQIIPNEFIRDP